jgi:hypothetical protein
MTPIFLLFLMVMAEPVPFEPHQRTVHLDGHYYEIGYRVYRDRKVLNSQVAPCSYDGADVPRWAAEVLVTKDGRPVGEPFMASWSPSIQPACAGDKPTFLIHEAERRAKR